MRDAGEAMQEIWPRGRQPLLVGGTMLYFHALTPGLAELPEADLRVRAEIDAQAAQRRVGGGSSGAGARWIRRRRRAFTATIRSASSAPSKCIGSPARRITPLATDRAGPRLRRRGGAWNLRSRPSNAPSCTPRIESRVQGDAGHGFLEEVRTLYERGDLTAEHPSMRAVGYRQAWQYLAGQCALNEAEQEAIAATRQLAKRQLTWLRRRANARLVGFHASGCCTMVLGALSEGGFA